MKQYKLAYQVPGATTWIEATVNAYTADHARHVFERDQLGRPAPRDHFKITCIGSEETT